MSPFLLLRFRMALLLFLLSSIMKGCNSEAAIELATPIIASVDADVRLKLACFIRTAFIAGKGANLTAIRVARRPSIIEE